MQTEYAAMFEANDLLLAKLSRLCDELYKRDDIDKDHIAKARTHLTIAFAHIDSSIPSPLLDGIQPK